MDIKPEVFGVEPFTLAEAQSWFEQHSGSISEVNAFMRRGHQQNPFFENRKFYPSWSKALNAIDPNYYVVDCPLNMDSTVGLITRKKGLQSTSEQPNAMTRLLILKDRKTGKIRSAIMFVHFDGSINQGISYAQRKNFSGSIFFTTLQGQLINGWAYENGKVVKRIRMAEESKIKSQLNPMGLEDPGDYGPSDCHYEYVDYYERYCYYNTGTGEITSCTEWRYEYTETYMFCDGGGQGGGGGGSGYIEHDEPEPPEQPDPCATTQAQQASDFVATSNFINAKIQIQNAASDGKEHGITFGKSPSGSIIVSEMSTGDQYEGTTPVLNNKFADIHNHQDNSAPSPGDIYSFIDGMINQPDFTTRYILASGGDVYALVLTDKQAAISFNSSYPRVIETYTDDQGNVRQYPPGFPDEIFNIIDEVQNSLFNNNGVYSSLIRDESSLAFILQQYNSGISLLKMDGSGQFKKIKTSETNTNGTPVYTIDNCL